MKNLEQIRAGAALGPAKTLDKIAVNKLPALILANGLLATVAFIDAQSESLNRNDMRNAMLVTVMHLNSLGLVTDACTTLEDFAKEISNNSSQHLQRVTSESLAFIGYLRRFAKKKGNE
jgi:CRISPR type III-B/RAMP module-associated protein Cmr5